MNSENKLNVVFGAGPLGITVAQKLIDKGKKVRVVSRNGSRVLPDGADVVLADGSNHSESRKVCEGASVVFHCANPPYEKWSEKFPSLTEGILQGAKSAGAKLVFGDNLYAYGKVQSPLIETMPLSAKTKKGKVRAGMETRLIEAHERGEVDVAIGKASDFFGPFVENSSMGNRVFPNILDGKTASVLGKLDVPHTYTFIEDFADGLIILSENSVAFGESWHIPAEKTLTTSEFISLICEDIGKPYKVSAMPTLMMKFLGIFIPPLAEMQEMLYQMEKPFIVDHSKFEHEFGNISTPLVQSIHKTINWYRDKMQN